MDTFAPWNEDAFAAPQAYDPVGDRSWLETAGGYAKGLATLPADLMQPAQRGALSEIFDAADRQQRLLGASNARQQAQVEAYDTIIRRVRDATGVTLDHPLFPRLGGPRLLEGLDLPMPAEETAANARAAFFDQARALQQQHPDALGDLDLSGDMAGSARTLAAGAAQGAAAQWARADVNPVAQLGATLAGSMWGSRRDPLFWAQFALPGEGVGASLAARIGTAALKQGTGMAALTALAQPAVQSWRNEVGLDSGFGEGLKETAWSFLFGALPGAALQGGHEAVAALRRIARGRAAPADFARAAEAGAHVDEPAQQAYGVAQTAADAQPELTGGLTPAERERAPAVLPDALAHAEDPDHPPPPAHDFAPADAPLGAPLAEAVQRGEVPPEHAALIAQHTLDPAQQGRLAEVLREAAPADPLAARQAIAEAAGRDSAVEAGMARMGVAEGVDIAAPPPSPPRALSTRRRTPQTLVQFLRAHGGIRDEGGDLRAMGLVEKRGGLVNNRTGLPLDTARELAAEAGYLGGDTETAVAHSSINDLLAAIDGPDRFSVHDDDVMLDRLAKKAAPPQRPLVLPLRSARKQVRDAVTGPDGLQPDPQILDIAAAHMAHGEESDPVAAWDRAAIEYERDLVHISDRIEAAHEPADAIPFDDADFHPDAGAAPRQGEPSARPDGGDARQGGAGEGPGGPPRHDGGADRPPPPAGSGAGVNLSPKNAELLSSIARFLRNDMELRTRRLPDGRTLLLDGERALAEVHGALTQESALEAMARELRFGLEAAGEHLQNDPAHMSLDEFTLAHHKGMFPEFEVSGDELGSVVVDRGDGLRVDVRKLYEKFKRENAGLEPGAEGKPQGVIPGAERIGDRQLAQRRADAGLQARAPQNLDTSGLALFGDAHKQTDMFDLAPVPQDDGAVRLMSREEIANVGQREEGLSAFVQGCHA